MAEEAREPAGERRPLFASDTAGLLRLLRRHSVPLLRLLLFEAALPSLLSEAALHSMGIGYSLVRCPYDKIDIVEITNFSYKQT